MGIFLKEKKKCGQIISVAPDSIELNPNQPRKYFDRYELDCLAQSIKENGLLQPLTVRIREDGRYELISGERRLRAVKIAGLDKVDVIVSESNEEKSAVMAVIENIQRCDLNCIEEAIALQKLINHYGYTQEELAGKLGKAQSTIANKLRILKLSEDVLKKTIEYGFCERQIRALLRLAEDKRKSAVEHIHKYQLNVDSTEKYIEKVKRDENKPPKFKWTFKEKRLYINNINKTLETMKRSGIEFSSEKREENGVLEYIIRIPHD